MEWLIKGILLGISIGLLVGPLFFALIQAGMEYGFRKGFLFAAGIWISDFILLMLTYFIFKNIPLPTNTDDISPILIVICAAAFILIGLNIMLSPTKKMDHQYLPTSKLWTVLVTKGFIVNTMNPSAFLIWMSVATIANKITLKPSGAEILMFYLSIGITIIGLDLLKIFLGKKIALKFKDGILSKFKYVSGVFFIINGLYLVYVAIF